MNIYNYKMLRPTEYNISTPYIEYTANEGYRNHIRTIFNMDMAKVKASIEKTYDLNTIDEETMDELMVDMDKMEEVMNIIFDHTKHDDLFNELYMLAAGRMFSTQPDIGQLILFSYSYFYLFHPCVCLFYTEPSNWTSDCILFTQLKKSLTTK